MDLSGAPAKSGRVSTLAERQSLEDDSQLDGKLLHIIAQQKGKILHVRTIQRFSTSDQVVDNFIGYRTQKNIQDMGQGVQAGITMEV